MNISTTYQISIGYLSATYRIPIDTVWYIYYICSIFAIIYRVLISIYIDSYRYCLICILYLTDIYLIFIITYRVPNVFMIYNWYFTTRYMYIYTSISVVYVSVFLHKYYTYQVSDMCKKYAYTTDIEVYIYTYRVLNRYLIASILTCVYHYWLLILNMNLYVSNI